MIEESSVNSTSLNSGVHPIIIENSDSLTIQQVIVETSNETSIHHGVIITDASSSADSSLKQIASVEKVLPKEKNAEEYASSTSKSEMIVNINEATSSTSSIGEDGNCSYSDSLVKEVLAAKETLKKYIGDLATGKKVQRCNGANSKRSNKDKKKNCSSNDSNNSKIRYLIFESIW